jgi:hypothetical protein
VDIQFVLGREHAETAVKALHDALITKDEGSTGPATDQHPPRDGEPRLVA